MALTLPDVSANVSRPPLSPTSSPTRLDGDDNRKRPSPVLPPLDDDDATSPSEIVVVSSPPPPSLPDVVTNAARRQQRRRLRVGRLRRPHRRREVMRGEGHRRLPLSSSRIGDDVGESGGRGSTDAFYVRGGRVVVVVMGGKGGGGTLSVCHRRRHCRAAFYRAAWETTWGREGVGGQR